MKVFVQKWFLAISLFIPLYTVAKAADKPTYHPTTQHKLGLGAAFVLPQNTIPALLTLLFSNKRPHISPYYKLHATASYALINLRESYLSLDGNVNYGPVSIANKELGVQIKEEHIRLCPAIAFTSINNKRFYVLGTMWFGYEWDFIFNSQLTNNGVVVTAWPSTKIMGNIIFGSRAEYFYGIYVDFNMTLPITEFVDTIDRLMNPKKKYPVYIKGKDYFLETARYQSASYIDIGLGVNLLSLLYPPQVDETITETEKTEKEENPDQVMEALQ